MGRFGLGQPVRRTEDPRLLTGRGCYAADVSLPGQVHAVFLRAQDAHAEIIGIDTTAAAHAPGVLAVLTAAEVAADGLGDCPCAVPVFDRAGDPLPAPGRRLLARERVRFAGEPIAMIVAETRDAATAAAALIHIDLRPLPAVATIDAACAGDAPQLWEGAPDNMALFWERGDAAAVDAAFATAARSVTLDVVNNRVVACALEPRATVGAYEAASGRYTLWTSCQGAHVIKTTLAQHTLRVPEESIRVLVGDVGGAFGAKFAHYPEEALTLWAAKRVGRPVKWVATRRETFLGDVHGRDHLSRIAGAFDADGRLLALRIRTRANLGAYLNYFAPAIPSQMMGCMLTGVYAVPAIHATCEGVYTNTTPVDAYRGAGRPEATYLLERFIEHAGRALGLTAEDIRRRNFIRPEQMPYTSPMGPTYDTGDFAARMEAALAAADRTGFAARRSEAAARGRLRGMGLSTYIEICGFDAETASIRFTEDDRIEVLIGTQSSGQGHETAYAQIAADGLGVPLERVQVIQGDTDRIATGKGTGGSRSLPVGGPAVQNAVAAVIARGRVVAARLLQTTPERVSFDDGRFSVDGGARGFSVLELARAARAPDNRPPPHTPGHGGGESDGEVADLDADARFRIAASTFPNGCHACEVEIDPETGETAIVGYWVVDDFGTVVNPLLLTGQVHGGIVQGIGQALMEHAVFDAATGRPLATSFGDYALPHATDAPDMAVAFEGIPCATHPLGIKGAGEAGTIAACPAVINAVLDALAPHGVTTIDMPATPEAIWRALAAAPGESP